ncbi:hypothetical protein CK203_063543 [Vitis vinifera]|uniref:DUF4283 domain-containing protein n=1 Tax=Vitis vinifera TaxID=29760 RepID=A0A438G3G2_VITVI|nr:hypothetical protein CK203_063543 [Vitis vinifera]
MQKINLLDKCKKNGKDLEGLCGEEDLLVRVEGEVGGNWCSITEHSKGSVFVLGLEKEKSLPLIGSHLSVIPEGDNGRGWELLKSALNSMLVVPSSSFVEKGRQSREGRIMHKNAGPLQRSYAKVVRDEGPRKGGLVPVGRWARAVVCECQDGAVNWVEADRAMARRLGHKGVVTIVPFAEGKGLFFVETLEEALSLHDSRSIRIKGGIRVLLRRWSPKENSEVEGRFKEVGTVTEIDWRTLKLFDLSKARVKVVMKERSVLPALIEVVDGGWDFTVSVAVAVKEEGWQVREMGESTRQSAETHKGTVAARGKRKVDQRLDTWKEQDVSGIQLVPTSIAIGFKKAESWICWPKQAGGAKAQLTLQDGFRAPKLCQEPILLGKVKSGHEDPENQQRDSAMKRGSRKLWNALLPSSSVCRQGDRSRSEPLTTERSTLLSDTLLMEDGFEAGTQLVQGCSEEGTTPRKERADEGIRGAKESS